MTGQELLDAVYTVYRGKGQSKTPLWGSEKANIVISIYNRKKNEWASDSDQTWASTFSMTSPNEPGTVATTGTTTLTGTGTYFTDYQIGDKITVYGETERTIDSISSDTSLTVSVAFSNTASSLTFTHSIIVKTGIQSYKLHRGFMTPSDMVQVTTSLQTYQYGLCTPQERTAATYLASVNPRILTFVNTITATDQAVGGVLSIPAYYKPADIVNATDLVAVDNPEWAVYVVASELARNDPAKEDQFGTLLGMANDLYIKMVSANFNIGFLQGGTVTNAMPQISPDLEIDWTL